VADRHQRFGQPEKPLAHQFRFGNSAQKRRASSSWQLWMLRIAASTVAAC